MVLCLSAWVGKDRENIEQNNSDRDNTWLRWAQTRENASIHRTLAGDGSSGFVWIPNGPMRGSVATTEAIVRVSVVGGAVVDVDVVVDAADSWAGGGLSQQNHKLDMKNSYSCEHLNAGNLFTRFIFFRWIVCMQLSCAYLSQKRPTYQRTQERLKPDSEADRWTSQ